MCLYIKEEHKSLLTGKYEAKKADKDIFVTKILCLDNGKWKTPYAEMPINFVNGECVLKPFTKKDFEGNIIKDYAIKKENGYHSYMKYTLAIKYSLYKYEKSFVAKIPKGSYYYEGIFGDICSNKLIIYELCA